MKKIMMLGLACLMLSVGQAVLAQSPAPNDTTTVAERPSAKTTSPILTVMENVDYNQLQWPVKSTDQFTWSIYRGTDSADLRLLKAGHNHGTFKDTDIKPGVQYFYKVVAESEVVATRASNLTVRYFMDFRTGSYGPSSAIKPSGPIPPWHASDLTRSSCTGANYTELGCFFSGIPGQSSSYQKYLPGLTQGKKYIMRVTFGDTDSNARLVLSLSRRRPVADRVVERGELEQYKNKQVDFEVIAGPPAWSEMSLVVTRGIVGVKRVELLETP